MTNPPKYRIADINGLPKEAQEAVHIGRKKGAYTEAFLALVPGRVAIFEPCPAKHRVGTCSAAGLVHKMAKKNGLQAHVYHVQGNLYISRA